MDLDSASHKLLTDTLRALVSSSDDYVRSPLYWALANAYEAGRTDENLACVKILQGLKESTPRFLTTERGSTYEQDPLDVAIDVIRQKKRPDLTIEPLGKSE